MNKIKGSSSAVKMKYLLFVFAASVLVSLPTRVYQLLALVDTTNGFFKESDITIPVLYGVVIVFGLLFLALSFVSKEVPSPKLPTGKNPVLGVASFVMVAGLGLDMFKVLTEVVPFNQGNAGIFFSLLKNNFVENGGIFMLLRFVFAFFAIIYFLVFAISHLNGKASYKEFKILALSPLCWSMTILISNLMNAVSFIKVSELLFEIFMFVFVMLFFLTFARISSGVFTEDSMWGIYGYGLCASLLAAIVTIPRLVMMFVGLDAVEGNEFDFVHLTTLVFILAYIFASLGVGFKEGLRARREVSEIELPDADAVVKKEDFNAFFEDAEAEAEVEAVEETISPLASFEEAFEIAVEEPEEAVAEEAIELVEEPEEAVAEEAIELVEEPVEEIIAFVEAVVEEAAEEEIIVASEPVEESVELVFEAPSEETVEDVVEEAVEVIEAPVEDVVEEVKEDALEEIAAPTEVVEDFDLVFEAPVEEKAEAVEASFEEIAEEAPKATVFEALEYTEAEPEAVEKKKMKLFKKSPKMKQAPSRKDAGDTELTAISLADLKNRNKE